MMGQTEDPQPAKGLPNLGNTCFYNSTMQCLMHTHALHKWSELVTEKTELLCKAGTLKINKTDVEIADAKIPLKDMHMPLVNELQLFLLHFRQGKNPNPSSLFGAISMKAPRFRGWQQQDAHELLRYLLDGIRTEECKRFQEGIESFVKEEDKEKRKLLIKAVTENSERCYVDSIFGGSLLQMIQCSKCGHVSNSLEPFLDLSLPLNYSEVPPTPILPPRNRREDTPSKHQQKKARKQAKKEAKKQQKLVKKNGTESSLTETSDFINNDSPMVTDDADIKPIDGSGSEASDDDSKGEESSSGETSGAENSDKAEVNGNVANGSNNRGYGEVLASPSDEGDTQTRTLINSLIHFTRPENLCAANAYECEKCCAPHNKELPSNSNKKKTVEASKRYLIYSPPCVLTIHLKRFEQVPLMGNFSNRVRTRKIRGHIEFPFILDLGQFCAKNAQRIPPGQTKVIYSLYGIVVHSGDLGGGHYIAYIKSRRRVESLSSQFMKLGLEADRLTTEHHCNGLPKGANSMEATEKTLRDLNEDSQWYYCSDSHVRPTDVSEVERAEAYILFYERII
ncbi:hypothetical protein FO519_001721 [Halicephalobus sp. NKZ332]|nr:hypothetical protein FO519_001721 [Halicephalobus sp. NKZ332]